MIFPNPGVLRRLLFFLFCCGLALGQNGALRVREPAPSKDGTIVTTEPAIWLKGTLAWTGGDMRVLWTSNRGFSDLASVRLAADGRTVEWTSTAPIPLRPGVNHVRIRALGQPGAAAFVNVFYNALSPPLPPPVGTAIFRGKPITYELIDGLAVYQGDMILGRAADVASGRFDGRLAGGGIHPQSATIAPNPASPTGLWPIVNGVVRVPYTMTSVNSANINAAIAESNTQLAGVLQWVLATGSDVNLVNFDFNAADQSGSCEAVVGMEGGTQPVGGAGNCTTNTILHEMGHAIGLFHEQSRADRNSFVSYMESNVDKPQHANFDIFASGADSGLFNYASIMEYSAFLFSRYGTMPVLETIPAGIVLGSELPQYTTGDLDGIERLYGFPPTAITVDTNPTGLQVLVDGAPCTAPCVLSNWTLGSQHTLAVPLDGHNQTLQILSQQPYIFGNWNTPSTSQSILITNSPGNGMLLSPANAPAITNYLASFIPVHPYNPQVSPSGAGTLQVTPTPATLVIDGVTTSYFPDRAYVSLNAQPAFGHNFYVWANVALDLPYSRTYNTYLTSNFDFYNFDTSSPVTAFFVSDTVTNITSGAPDIVAGIYPSLAVGVVETSHANATAMAYTPRNFDASQDGPGFAGGSQLTLCASGQNGASCPATAVTQSPVTTNINYLFDGWNGSAGGATNAVNVTLPSSGLAGYTANYAASFRVIILPSISAQFCSGVAITSVPVGTNSQGTNGAIDAFYSAGTTNFSATAGTSGLNFVGWTQDLSGSASPYAYSLQGELIATANFNVTGTSLPLAVTSVSPAAPSANSAVNLVVTGTGFTTNNAVTIVYFVLPDGAYSQRTGTLTSATQLTIHLLAGDIPSVGYYQIAIRNSNAGSCNPTTQFTFPVGPAVAPTLQSIAVTPASPSIPKGTTQQFTATGTYSDSSTQNLTSQVTWVSANTAHATITSGGLASGAAIGTSTISATLGSVTGSTVLTVAAAALQSIAVTPASPTIVVAGTQQFMATGTYSDNSTQNLTSQVTWMSANTAAATITSGGLATGAGVGTSTIGAALNSVTGSTVLTVTALSKCDVNLDGAYTIADVQRVINEGLGTMAAANDLNSDGAVTGVDVQIDINAVLGLGCSAH